MSLVLTVFLSSFFFIFFLCLSFRFFPYDLVFGDASPLFLFPISPFFIFLEPPEEEERNGGGDKKEEEDGKGAMM